MAASSPQITGARGRVPVGRRDGCRAGAAAGWHAGGQCAVESALLAREIATADILMLLITGGLGRPHAVDRCPDR